ncbi:hypothetical protein HZB08_01950 [Candidatus Saganbacteria bacterium]|uniref:Tyrosine--tRNA ligase n=1 Tax=Candidatus Saganbacteria bacterium TaxID=2575572 RepID=A0A9D6YVW0_UNCSA|nr:hypothetical protein [Candidatus Saganbacteria bacterium]
MDAHRLIQPGGVSIDGDIIKDEKLMVALDKERMIKVGKRRFLRVGKI